MPVDVIELAVGQVWRTRGGNILKVLSNDGDENYPWNLEHGECVTNRGTYMLDSRKHKDDLVELVTDEHGFTIWRGGDRPVEASTQLTVQTRDGRTLTSAGSLCRWTHNELGFDPVHDIVAYKVIEAEVVDAEVPKAEPEFVGGVVDAEPMTIGVDMGAPGGDKTVAMVEIPPGYDGLFSVLLAAFEQASCGKGKERHASAGVAFEDQPISAINRTLGSVDGLLYQAAKKSAESRRLPTGRAQAEIYGAINYLAAVAIAYDTWAEKVLPTA